MIGHIIQTTRDTPYSRIDSNSAFKNYFKKQAI